MTMVDRLRREGAFLPVLTVVASLIVIWYAGAVYLNSTQLIDRYQKQDINWDLGRLAKDAWRMQRPVLPSPHQVAIELKKTVLDKRVTSKRSLVYHAGITLSSALLGFGLGTLIGVALAIGIVYVTTLDRSLMPWIIASQTVPILALAPMIIVVLGSVGVTGLFPKSVISMYLCFFPVVVGMVKGLRSPEPILIDQMNTYSASPTQVFFKLRLPSSLPFLFTSLKVAIALSVVGAIVAELPTGGQGGLGARLLTGSYYGQITMIWAALIVASIVSALLVTAIGRAERIALRRLNGGQVVTA